MRGGDSTVLACLREGQLLATAMVGHDGHRAWVYYLAVRQDERKHGLGRMLMRSCEEWAAARAIPKLQLMVRTGNEDVLAFYARLDYPHRPCSPGVARVHAKGAASQMTSRVFALNGGSRAMLMHAGLPQGGHVLPTRPRRLSPRSAIGGQPPLPLPPLLVEERQVLAEGRGRGPTVPRRAGRPFTGSTTTSRASGGVHGKAE